MDPIIAKNLIKPRAKKLAKLLQAMNGTEQDAVLELQRLSGLSYSYLMKFKRGEFLNTSVRSLEKLDKAMHRVEARLGIAL
jgi:hypothetical protein